MFVKGKAVKAFWEEASNLVSACKISSQTPKSQPLLACHCLLSVLNNMSAKCKAFPAVTRPSDHDTQPLAGLQKGLGSFVSCLKGAGAISENELAIMICF